MDPYLTLKISPDATDEQVRAAYRECMREFVLKDENELTEYDRGRMSELNAAYDAIVAQRQSGGGYSGSRSVDYAGIRKLIRSNRLDEAQSRLDSVPQQAKTGEWYYLQGLIQQRKGWFNAALENYSIAVRIDPSNSEYNQAYENTSSRRSGGYDTRREERRARSSGNDDCSCCDICRGLALANCLCELCDGDDNYCCFCPIC